MAVNTSYPGHRASDKPRCKTCSGFLAESAGHNRAMCPNCGTPVTWYVEDA